MNGQPPAPSWNKAATAPNPASTQEEEEGRLSKPVPASDDSKPLFKDIPAFLRKCDAWVAGRLDSFRVRLFHLSLPHPPPPTGPERIVLRIPPAASNARK